MSLDKRIKCIYQDNQGLSGARNTGLLHCQGEFIFFMDSDDIIEHDALEKCYELATEKQAEICIFDASVFYEKGAKSLDWNYDRSNILIENKKYDGKILFNELIDNMKYNAVVWLQFIRRSYLTKLNLVFLKGIIHEDELFTPQLLFQSDNIYYINQKFIRHRIRNSSIVGKGYSERNINCYLTVIDNLLKFQNSPLIEKYAKYTLSKVFYTGHIIAFPDKIKVFWRAMKSGYLKYIGIKSVLVFWLKITKSHE